MIASMFHGKINSGFTWHRPSSNHPDIEHPLRKSGSWIDNGWAPRRWKHGYIVNAQLVKDPRCCWQAEQLKWQGVWAGDPAKLNRIEYDSEEFPQGYYLIHHVGDWLANMPDVTLMSWWDRCQGDQRGGCSSSLLVADLRSDAEMIERLSVDFPSVLANLTKAGVTLQPATADSRW